MKIEKTASGSRIKLSKKEWEAIGKKAGWEKESKELPLDNRERSDIDWGSAVYEGDKIVSIYKIDGTPLSKEEIANLNLTNEDERLTDPEPILSGRKSKLQKEALLGDPFASALLDVQGSFDKLSGELIDLQDRCRRIVSAIQESNPEPGSQNEKVMIDMTRKANAIDDLLRKF
jgi:hypothetical protein